MRQIDPYRPQSVVRLINDLEKWRGYRETKQLGSRPITEAVEVLTAWVQALGYWRVDKQVRAGQLVKAQQIGPLGWATQHPAEAKAILQEEVMRLSEIWKAIGNEPTCQGSVGPDAMGAEDVEEVEPSSADLSAGGTGSGVALVSGSSKATVIEHDFVAQSYEQLASDVQAFMTVHWPSIKKFSWTFVHIYDANVYKVTIKSRA